MKAECPLWKSDKLLDISFVKHYLKSLSTSKLTRFFSNVSNHVTFNIIIGYTPTLSICVNAVVK